MSTIKTYTRHLFIFPDLNYEDISKGFIPEHPYETKSLASDKAGNINVVYKS
jgi:hypothetical protein